MFIDTCRTRPVYTFCATNPIRTSPYIDISATDENPSLKPPHPIIKLHAETWSFMMVEHEGQLLNQPDEVAKLLFKRSMETDFTLPSIKAADRLGIEQSMNYTM